MTDWDPSGPVSMYRAISLAAEWIGQTHPHDPYAVDILSYLHKALDTPPPLTAKDTWYNLYPAEKRGRWDRFLASVWHRSGQIDDTE